MTFTFVMVTIRVISLGCIDLIRLKLHASGQSLSSQWSMTMRDTEDGKYHTSLGIREPLMNNTKHSSVRCLIIIGRTSLGVRV